MQICSLSPLPLGGGPTFREGWGEGVGSYRLGSNFADTRSFRQRDASNSDAACTPAGPLPLDFAGGPVTPTMSLQEFDSTPLLTYEMSVIARRDHPCADSTSLHRCWSSDWVVNYTPSDYGVFMQMFSCPGVCMLPDQVLDSPRQTGKVAGC